MNSELKETLGKFLSAFEQVFDRDWEYTKEQLGISKDDDQKSHEMNLETIYTISPGATFLNPEVKDEIENWGYRGMLLSEYRKLKSLLPDI